MQIKCSQRLRMTRKQTSVRSMLTFKHVAACTAYVFQCIKFRNMMLWVVHVSQKVNCFFPPTVIIALESPERIIICQILLDSGRKADSSMDSKPRKRKINEFFDVAAGPSAIEARPDPNKTYYQQRLEERLQRMSAAETNLVACPDVESICRGCVEKDNTVRFNSFYVKMNVYHMNHLLFSLIVYSIKIAVLKNERREVNKKFFDLRQRYSTLLEKQIRIQKQSNADEEQSREPGGLSKPELSSLNSIGLDKKHDSTFIRKLLLCLYKSDMEVMSQRSLKGTTPKIKFEGGQVMQTLEKRQMTPEKLNTISTLFHNRLSKVNEIGETGRQSETYLNALINRGFQNINKKSTTQTINYVIED